MTLMIHPYHILIRMYLRMRLAQERTPRRRTSRKHAGIQSSNGTALTMPDAISDHCS